MKRPIAKAARLVLLSRLRDAGVLDGLTLQRIADVLGVNRSTIHRDLQALDQVEAEYRRLMGQQPWLEPTPEDILRSTGHVPLVELAEITGYNAEHLRLLARDGQVQAKKRSGEWWVNRQSLETYINQTADKPGPPRGPHDPRG